MPKPTLSNTARVILIAASEHPERVATLPAQLPAAAQHAVVRSLLKAGLLEEVEAEGESGRGASPMRGKALRCA